MTDESVLLERARILDESALATIFDSYYGMIYRYVYLHTGHAETAEDLSAQVFRRLLEKLRGSSGPDHYLKAWLFRVASNLIVDESRRAQQRDHLPLDEHLHMIDGALEETVDASLLLAQLRAALATLPPTQRSVVIMHYLMDMSNEEIASILEMSIGAVKGQQHRALVSLRREMKQEDNHEQTT